jgi:aminoglycoside phosphotransferase (APT) family kinase protein
VDPVIDEALVRGLLADQHPDLADRPLALAGQGWDNAMYRLGDDLVVRLPTRDLAAPLADHEHRWLPEVAPRLPLPVPVPVRLGEPGRGYPYRWSITPWFPGRPALVEPPTDLDRAADQLAAFAIAMAEPAPADAPPNPYRGVPLGDRSFDTVPRIHDLAVDEGEREALLACWHHHVALPAWPGEPRWIHGDLHLLNLIVHEGSLSAVIDFGDITAGDPATDLFAAWMLFDAPQRARLRAAAHHLDDDGWGRARGWALCMALAYLANTTATNQLRPLGRATVDRVLADWLAER